ncbi:hypothetical protein ACQPXH_27205 [Nocardia sp. CA-135953]|uniref:hypothetical protein n=1 Tax=Nocardia sp. CA-135953 TaxID=3239978 RepID=UPI003D97A9FF
MHEPARGQLRQRRGGDYRGDRQQWRYRADDEVYIENIAGERAQDDPGGGNARGRPSGTASSVAVRFSMAGAAVSRHTEPPAARRVASSGVRSARLGVCPIQLQ